jgi:hypothetical protein
VSQPHEIRLIVERASGKYEARWVDSAGQSPPFPIDLPLTAAEMSELRWYLEVYFQKPGEGDHDRAQKIQACFRNWGERLFRALFGSPDGPRHYQTLIQAAGASQYPVFTLASDAPEILGQPWEMLRDTAQRALVLKGVNLRRQFWQRSGGTGKEGENAETASDPHGPPPLRLPLRVLLLVSRPRGLGLPDSHSSLATLVTLPPSAVKLALCHPATMKRLRQFLDEAEQNRERFDIFHFDGHGNFQPATGEGVLYFERENGKEDPVTSARLGDLLARYQVPLVLLEACRSADLSVAPVLGSIAPSLLNYGVSNVIGFSHAIHVEATRLLVQCFYQELAAGKSVGQALATSRGCLRDTPYRRVDHGADPQEVSLEDWFVPQLYQMGDDPVPAANPAKTVTISFQEPLQQLDEKTVQSLRSAVASTLRIPPDAFRIDVTEWKDD